MKITLSETYKLIPGKQRLLFAAILIVQFFLSLYLANTQTFTLDEGGYYSYGVKWLKGNGLRTDTLDDSKSPVIIPALIPRVVKQVTDPSYKPADWGQKYMNYGRGFMWIYVLLISYVFICWSFRLFKKNAWSIALVLLLFDPLFFSYGMQIGTDMATTAMLFTLIYIYWRYRQTKARRYLILTALFLGLSLVAKLSLLFILPLAAMIFLIRLICNRQYRTVALKRKFLEGLLIMVIALFVINIAYYFKGVGTTLSHYPAESALLVKLKSVPVLNKIPMPLPYSYVQSIDMSLRHEAIGGGRRLSTYPGININGVYKQDGGIWYYYLFTLLFKMPLLILILFGIYCVYTIASLRRDKNTDKLYYIVPLFYFLFILSAFNSFQIGVRHILIIFPFIYLAVGDVICKAVETKYKYILYLFILIHFFLLFKMFPYWMAYSNEIVPDKKNLHKYIVDSSIDYGQSSYLLPKFLADNPGYSYPTSVPAAGKFIVELSRTYSIWKSDPDPFAWLRNNFEPSGHYHSVYVLFEISEEDLKKIK